jgi:hypothetical protein
VLLASNARARAAVASEDQGCCGLPGLATLVVALAEAVALGDAGHDREDSLSLPPMMLLFSIELAAVVALVAILACQSEVVGRCSLRLVVVLWGTTAFGAIHTVAEYVAMIIFSDRDWDTLPAPDTSQSPSSPSAQS